LTTGDPSSCLTESTLGLLRFRGQVDYAFRLALMSLRSYSMGLMLPSVE
jgi:hypothetical protein